MDTGGVHLVLIFIAAILNLTNADIPTEVQVILENDDNDNATYIGKQTKMTARIGFPSGQTDDCTVRILTSNGDIRMAIVGNITVTTDSNTSLTYTGDAVPTMTRTSMSRNIAYDTKATLDFGQVSNNGTDVNNVNGTDGNVNGTDGNNVNGTDVNNVNGTDGNSGNGTDWNNGTDVSNGDDTDGNNGTDGNDSSLYEIAISFNVVLVNDENLANGSDIGVSFDVSYNTDITLTAREVFVFYVKSTNTITPTLSVTSTSTTIDLGESTSISFRMNVPMPTTNLDIKSSIRNESWSTGLIAMYVDRVGKGYNYSLVLENLHVDGTSSTDCQWDSNTLDLSIGQVVNKEYYEPDHTSDMDDIDVIVELGTMLDEVLVATNFEICVQLEVTMDNSVLTSSAACLLVVNPVAEAFTDVSITGPVPEDTSTGQSSAIIVDIRLPAIVGDQLTISATVSAAENTVHLLGIYITDSTLVKKSCLPDVYEEYTDDTLDIVTMVSLSTFGENTGTGVENRLRGLIPFLLMPSATTNNVYEVDVMVSKNSTGESISRSITIAVGPPPSYPDKHNFDLNLTSSCGDMEIWRDSPVLFTVDIEPPEAITGAMFLEVPFPPASTMDLVDVCEATVIYNGTETPCLAIGPDNILELAKTKFILMCDMEHDGEISDTTLTIKMIVNLLYDDTKTANGASDFWAISIRSTGRQIWAAQHGLTFVSPTCFNGLVMLTAFKVHDNGAGGPYSLHLSSDGKTFYDVDTATISKGSLDADGFQEYLLLSPRSTNCAFVTRVKCQTLCNTFTIFSTEMLKVQIANDNDNTIYAGMHHAVDGGGRDTCFDLPAAKRLFFVRLETAAAVLKLNKAPFYFKVTGRNISCERDIIGGVNKITQVSHRYTSTMDTVKTPLQFCALVNDIEDGPFRTCEFNCACQDTNACSEVMIFMLKLEDSDDWKLCDISAYNY